MAQDTFFHLTFKNVSVDEEDLLSNLCFEFGALGVSEDLQFTQMRDDYQPELVSKKEITLNGFFESLPEDLFFFRLSEEYPHVVVEKNEEKNRDWLEEWKKGFKPFQLSGPYWVVPTWLEKPNEAEKAIWIDPGMAFGTGTHETTQMASELVLKNVSPNTTVLDVGTGTGILAFLARMQGATGVVGTDIDEQARRVVRENMQLNKLDDISIPDVQIEKIDMQFDVVIANIIDGVLLKLKDDLYNKVKLDGKMILSGILVEHERNFLSQFLKEGWTIETRLEKGEWLGFVLRS